MKLPLSFSYLIVDKVVNDFPQFVRRHVFDEDAPVVPPISTGFFPPFADDGCGNDLTYSMGKIFPDEGECHLAVFRGDILKVTPAILRNELEKTMREERQRNEGKFISRARKTELKELVTVRLLEKTLPTPQYMLVLATERRLRLFAAPNSVREAFMKLADPKGDALPPSLLHLPSFLDKERSDALFETNPSSFPGVSFNANPTPNWNGMGHILAEFILWLLPSREFEGRNEQALPLCMGENQRIVLHAAEGKNRITCSLKSENDKDTRFTELSHAMKQGYVPHDADIYLENFFISEFRSQSAVRSFGAVNGKLPRLADWSKNSPLENLVPWGLCIAEFEQTIHWLILDFVDVRLSSQWEETWKECLDFAGLL